MKIKQHKNCSCSSCKKYIMLHINDKKIEEISNNTNPSIIVL